ncbi:MAG: CAP domain-containing protein [Parcubacteria group bacterium]|jgi:hypothetical protein
MFEFLIWVKRVSHINKVSSKSVPEKFLALFCVAALSSFFALAFFTPPASASGITVQKVVELCNAERTKEGMGNLSENKKLDKSAEKKAEDMAEKDYFAHTSPGGVTPWHWIESENYDYAYAGENLAMDFTSAEKMNQAWLDSPTHRANILNEKYKDIGVSVKEAVISGHSTVIVVQQFGSGDKSEKEKISAEKPSGEASVRTEKSYPSLPPGTKNDKKIGQSISNPVITSPAQNEIVSNDDAEVIGRSAPNSVVSLWEGENRIGQTISDEKGWFRENISALPEGSHELRAESGEYAGKSKGTKSPLNVVGFSIDRSRPKVDYRLYAKEGESGSGEYFLQVTSDKPNCYFRIGGQSGIAENSGAAFFSISGRNLSSVVEVEDQAGNKTAKQIVLANYYQGDGGNNIINEITQMFSRGKTLADKSGGEAVKENSGFFSQQLLSMQMTEKR